MAGFFGGILTFLDPEDVKENEFFLVKGFRLLSRYSRVEVRSPDGLLPGIALDDLVAMHVTSNPRNQVLAGFLRDIHGYGVSDAAHAIILM